MYNTDVSVFKYDDEQHLKHISQQKYTPEVNDLGINYWTRIKTQILKFCFQILILQSRLEQNYMQLKPRNYIQEYSYHDFYNPYSGMIKVVDF